jgi:hypothetical protein
MADTTNVDFVVNNGITGYSNQVLTINTSGSQWTDAHNIISSSSNNGLHVSSNATIEGNLKVGGVDIGESLKSINQRLAILVPDPKKLEQFEALKRAYQHYKTLEALCDLPEKNE